MIGAPIYLVSACGTAAEFVAAFRRYADKQGIFVPIGEPFAIGRRGRFALTLKDGGVMIEGEAEVVMSSRTPSALYGRVGMTLRFVEPDDISRSVITELEKARLSMKLPEVTVVPRAASVPAEPRPVVPPPGGRIDAVNALAESIAIGEVTALRETAGAPLKSGPKFVVPAIPMVGGNRTQPITRPPDNQPPGEAKPQPGAPSSEARPEPVAAKPEPAAARPEPTDRRPPKITDTQLVAIAPPPRPASDRAPSDRIDVMPAAPQGSRSPMTATQPVAIAPPPTPRGRGTLPPPEPPRKPPTASKPPPSPSIAVDGFYPDGSRRLPEPPVVGEPPAVIEGSVYRGDETIRDIPGERESMNETQRGNGPLIKPAFPTAPRLPELEIESTDLASIPRPEPREIREVRKTQLGIAAVIVEPALPAERLDQSPAEEVAATAIGASDVDPHGETLSPDAMMIFSPPQRDDLAPALRPEVLAHPPTVEESTPSGDWTMTPDGPIATPKPIPKGSTTGDWTIAVDAGAPDGWAQPEKPRRPAPVRTGTALPSVASSEAVLIKQSWEPESTNMAMAKVEIDPTLMEPLQPMPELDDEPSGVVGTTVPPPELQPAPPWTHAPTPMPMPMPMPMMAPPMMGPPMMSGTPTPMPMAVPPMPPQHYGAPIMTPVPGTYYTPVPGQVMFDPNQPANVMGFPPPPQQRLATEGGAIYFPEGGPPQDATSMNDIGRRRRLHVILISAGLVVAVGIVLLVKLGGKKHDEPRDDAALAAAVQPSDAAVVSAPVDAAVAPIIVTAPIDAGAAMLPTPVDAAEPVPECSIDVTTTPPGAEIAIDNHTVIGASPGKFALPCGAELKLYIRKPAYNGVIRPVTPTPEGTKVRLALAHTPFQVKVSSNPAGATITVNGKSMGTTPTMIKLPAFEAATIVIAKDGYTPDTQRVTPKQDKQAVHAQLKKTGKRH